MANPVFDSALAAITQAMGAIETEIQRLQGVQQHLDALQSQRRELQATVNELAERIPASQNAIRQAEISAKALLSDADAEKGRIIARAHNDAAKIAEDASKAALLVVEQARKEAASYQPDIEEAKQQLSDIRDQITIANAQVQAARNTFAKLKQHAEAFAALEYS